MVANADSIINETVLSADMSKNKDRQLKEMVFFTRIERFEKKRRGIRISDAATTRR